ncbi:MAG: NADH-quinone oxidoreductase subunit L [Gammaproteobacteria bacterium]|nr:NADH-quinone oxidoreductase subunit L [Gammaproteobacteria bacterium]
MEWLWLVPSLPLAGFLILILTQGRMPNPLVAMIGAGSIGFAALVALAAGLDFYTTSPPDGAYAQVLWTWIDVGGFTPSITLYLDGLSLVMMGVITGVGFLIHLYATGYMAREEGFSRFFAYMNLFVFAMLMLVLGDNLLVLYLGWEGVGLCSYLLIGFFHTEPENGYAARKAFVVTRVGDTAMALGLFLLFRELGTLEIQAILDNAATLDPTICTIAALLLLGGAVGKSAQVPLQTWLPDAMAGPTPVSALSHAATMVTAGVYLIARMHDLFLLSPEAQFAVALVGVVTLFISSFTALTQTDIKRILAYSTMSQIGYMFMALGVGAWSAAIFHLMTHAFFKALLFLASGSVILALHHEQNIFKMGGLWRRLPIPFWSMVIGSAALAALPLTSGFYSKDVILLTSWDYATGGTWFWVFASIAAFMTALYSTRMIIITFFGEMKIEPHDESGVNMWGPLVVLAVLAVGGGWLGLAPLAGVLPDGGVGGGTEHSGVLVYITAAVPIAGVLIGYLIFGGRQLRVDSLVESEVGDRVRRFWLGGWGFDWLYDRVVVRPFMVVARINKRDVVDSFFEGVAAASRGLHQLATRSQTGQLRWYVANMVAGVLIMLLIALEVL